MIRLKAVTNRILSTRKDRFFFMRAQQDRGYHINHLPWFSPSFVSKDVNDIFYEFVIKLETGVEPDTQFLPNIAGYPTHLN